VVVALQELFVPVHISALNTPHCLRDPADAELLRSYIRTDTDDWDGGEREAFVLPDGSMLPVFLSLHGRNHDEWTSRASHYTAAERRAEAAVQVFRTWGERVLQRIHGAPSPRWAAIWAPGDAAVQAVAAVAPRWPEPAPGTAGWRVFVRNSYRQYDDLAGSEIVPLEAAALQQWLAPLAAGEERLVLPRERFVALARAMVPRGMVDTELQEASITGELALVVTARDTEGVRGRVEGSFALRPTTRYEVAKRENAACLFRSVGQLRGEFRFAAGRLQLRAVATDVAFAWQPLGGGRDEDHAPWHRVAFEWVVGQVPSRSVQR
jgi:hypothetical protein